MSSLESSSKLKHHIHLGYLENLLRLLCSVKRSHTSKICFQGPWHRRTSGCRRQYHAWNCHRKHHGNFSDDWRESRRHDPRKKTSVPGTFVNTLRVQQRKMFLSSLPLFAELFWILDGQEIRPDFFVLFVLTHGHQIRWTGLCFEQLNVHPYKGLQATTSLRVSKGDAQSSGPSCGT